MSQLEHKVRAHLGPRPISTGEYPVKVEIRIKGSDGKWRRTRKNTEVFVKPSNWTGKDGKWIKRGDPQHFLKNDQIKRVINSIDAPSAFAETIPLVQFIERYIHLSETAKSVGRIRILTYKSTLRILQEFEKETSYPLHYDTMNLNFISHFLRYLEDRGHSQNNRRKIVKVIKRFLKVAMNEGHHSNTSFTTEAWRVPEKMPETVYISNKELEQLEAVKLTEAQTRNRDLFILGCNLGLRYSDLQALTKKNIITHRDKVMIRTVQGKTGQPVVIPVNGKVQEIIDKYDGFPERISQQKFNDSIKVICEKAGLKEKAAQVSTHTMRRSFATNAYIAGVPAHSIMKITGHKSEASFLRYIRITTEENAAFIGDHEFFK
jgi:site-specific recombinase XerD